MKSPKPIDKRWRSTVVSTKSLEGGVLVDGVVSKTARLDGFDPHAPCPKVLKVVMYTTGRQRQQRLQRQTGAVTARFTLPAFV